MGELVMGLLDSQVSREQMSIERLCEKELRLFHLLRARNRQESHRLDVERAQGRLSHRWYCPQRLRIQCRVIRLREAVEGAQDY